jgi:hypothetical protein
MNVPNFNDYAIKLSSGSHSGPEVGMCVMECVAYIAGEEHTDRPECASVALSNLAIRLNDASYKNRHRLLPLVMRLASSRDASLESQRLEEVRKYFMFWDAFDNYLRHEENNYAAWHYTDPIFNPHNPYEYDMKMVIKHPTPSTMNRVLHELADGYRQQRWEAGFALLERLLPPLDTLGVEEAPMRKLLELVKITNPGAAKEKAKANVGQ